MVRFRCAAFLKAVAAGATRVPRDVGLLFAYIIYVTMYNC